MSVMSNRGKLCIHEGCGRGAMAKGMCEGHYKQNRIGQELRDLRPKASRRGSEVCRIHGCERWTKSNSLCFTHRRQQLDGIPFKEIKQTGININKTCKDCGDPATVKGRCNRCYARASREGARARGGD